MQKLSKREMRAVTDSSENNAVTVRREARLLSNQLQIPLAAALERAKIMAAKRREKLRRDHLRAVLKIRRDHFRAVLKILSIPTCNSRH